MEGSQQEAPVGRMHYRVRGPLRGHQHRRIRAARPPLPQQPAARGPAPGAPSAAQPVLEWAWVRHVRPVPLAALVLRWLLIAVLCLAVLDVARVAGVPIVLLVLVWSWSAAVRGRRRPRFPDRPAAPADRRPSPGTLAHPGVPPRGNPYDLETYLRRLRDDRR